MLKSNKVLVSGSSALSPELYPFVEALGRRIIQSSNLVLITGGLKHAGSDQLSSDFVVATAAKQATEEMGIDATQRIITMLPQIDREEVERFSYGNVMKVQHSNTKSRRYSMVLTSDAVIAIGGRTQGTGLGTGGTGENIDLAWAAGKPVLPIPSTGGAAEERWEKYSSELVSRFKISSDELSLLRARPIVPGPLANLCIELVKRCLKPRCFIAMKIDGHPLPLTYESISKVLERYNYTPIRVDLESFVGSIIDAIWDAIRNSEFVIADITGYNPNVFYELGIAHTFGKPTIIFIYNQYGCVPDDIPFDIRVQRILPYGTNQSLELQLDEQIRAVCTSAAVTITQDKTDA
jgi:hypothetical protein